MNKTLVTLEDQELPAARGGCGQGGGFGGGFGGGYGIGDTDCSAETDFDICPVVPPCGSGLLGYGL